MGVLKDLRIVMVLLVGVGLTPVKLYGDWTDWEALHNEVYGRFGVTWDQLLFAIVVATFLGVIVDLLFRIRRAEAKVGPQDYSTRLVNLETLVSNILARPSTAAQLGPTAEGLPGLLFSRVHFAANGGYTIIGQSENVAGVTDVGAGQWYITWDQYYADVDYHVSITPTAGQFIVETQTVGGISIRALDQRGQSRGIELNVYAIGNAKT